MVIDTTEPRSRRALLVGAVGGIAAVTAQALGRPVPVRATHGGYVQLAHSNGTTDVTSISRTDLAGGGTNVTFAGATYGLAANSHIASGIGASGATSAVNGVGVTGRTSGLSSQVALDGIANGGVGEGIAVRGRTLNGIALYGSATGGHALQIHGRAVFDRSGRAGFAAGQASRTISVGRLVSDSLVLATIQGNVGGTWVRGVSVNTTNGTFTIRLNRAAPSALRVGWFIVN